MDAARLTGFERVRRFAGELEPSRTYKRFHDFDRNRKPEHYGPILMPRPARA
jgi:hypothetical protein